MKIITIIAVLTVVAAGAAAAVVMNSDNSKNKSGPVTVTDYLGREVTITSTERIVSTSVVPTAILCGLGVSSRIVGVSSDAGVYDEAPNVIGLTDDDFPKAIVDGMSNGKITALGGMYRMSAETMASIPSDLVVCDSYGTNQDIRNAMDMLGITYVVVSSASSLNEVYDNIKLLGKVVSKEQTAERIISEMKSTIKKVTDWCESMVEKELKGKRYSVALMMSANYAVGKNYTGGDTLRALCANNVFEESIERYAAVTKESIAKVNPDVIIYSNLGMGDSVTDPKKYVASLHDDPILKGTGAVKNDCIFATIGAAKNATTYYDQGIVRAYALYAMFIYKDHLTFEVTNVLDGSNYADYLQQFWEMINS